MAEQDDKPDLVAIELWRLPTDFFGLDEKAQWDAFAAATKPAQKLTKPQNPCKLTLTEDLIASSYFLTILGIPLLLPVVTLTLLARGNSYWKWWLLGVSFFALHPIPAYLPWYRRNKIGVILAKYFTMTVLVDRRHPEMKYAGTPAIEENPIQAPLVPLACPHGVLNFGAIIWVFFSRWVCGLEQYTAGANIVTKVPGLRYLCASLWVIPADGKSIKRALQEPPKLEDSSGKRFGSDTPRRGGMVGIVPDGIAGIFKSKPGSDVLYIGKRRGLMRICLEEGALVAGTWFSGTPDLFRIVTDPFGVLEFLSRKLQVSLFLFFGRWGLPIPRRIPVTMCPHLVRCEKVAAPSPEQVERTHVEVYGGLERKYNEEMRYYTGFPARNLKVL